MSNIISTRLSEPIISFLKLLLQKTPFKYSWSRESTSKYLERLVLADLTKTLGVDASTLNQRKNYVESCERFGLDYQTSLDDLGW
jgi:hypothetical protein